MISSPLMTVMVDAVRKAARGLRRDFGEVENLQVSRKGPGDFVSAADRKAEEVLRDAHSWLCPCSLVNRETCRDEFRETPLSTGISCARVATGTAETLVHKGFAGIPC